MRTIQSLCDIADQAQTFFLDLYGVIFNGQTFYPKGLDVLQKLKAQGKKIAILSNSTLMTEDLEKRYTPLGLLKGTHYDQIISSGALFKKWLETTDYLDKIAGKEGLLYVIGLNHPMLFEPVQNRVTTDIQKASVVYVSHLRDHGALCSTLDIFLPEAQCALDKGLPMICANPDYFAFEGKTRYVTPGSLARWYEEHGGKVFWIGKPYANIYQYACQQMQADPATSIMVGDTIRTDIKGGQDAGMKTVLITKIGITHDAIMRGQTLQELVEASNACPTYLLEEIG